MSEPLKDKRLEAAAQIVAEWTGDIKGDREEAVSTPAMAKAVLSVAMRVTFADDLAEAWAAFLEAENALECIAALNLVEIAIAKYKDLKNG